MEILEASTDTQAEEFQNPLDYLLQSWEPEADRDKSWDKTQQKGHTENIFNNSTTPIPRIEFLLIAIKNENINLMEQNDKLCNEIQTMHLTFEQLSIQNGKLKTDNDYLQDRNNVLEHENINLMEQNDKLCNEIQTMHLTFEQLSIQNGKLKTDNDYLQDRNNVLEHAFQLYCRRTTVTKTIKEIVRQLIILMQNLFSRDDEMKPTQW